MKIGNKEAGKRERTNLARRRRLHIRERQGRQDRRKKQAAQGRSRGTGKGDKRDER